MKILSATFRALRHLLRMAAFTVAAFVLAAAAMWVLFIVFRYVIDLMGLL